NIHNKLSKNRIIKMKISEKLKKIEGDLKSDDIIAEDKEKLINRKVGLTKGNQRLNKYINELKTELKYLLNKHKGIRYLREDALQINKKIGMFDSALTRTLGMKIDSVSTDIMVVRVYYYQILEELISDGFVYRGERYIYFSSSAGQIRTKK